MQPVLREKRLNPHGENIQSRRSRDLELRGGTCQRQTLKIHKNDVEYKGYTHHATADDPQCEIKIDKTEHVAMHKGSALKKKNWFERLSMGVSCQPNWSVGTNHARTVLRRRIFVDLA